ncbi:MAG: response regulator transcription factor [Candidatus Dojkabacteria bacterium]|nr:response regulator transcription factor [Candidatus Dojkabacteria bacterium]
MRILIVEDEIDLLEALKKGLAQKGYAVDKSTNGQDALYKFRMNDYDVVLLDLNLPQIDGTEVCKRIRKKNSEIGIIMLTARGEIEDRVEGLSIGADDYIPKPFSFEEVVARIEALIRRKSMDKKVFLQAKNLTLDPVRRRAMLKGKVVDLNNKEFRILEYLMRNKGKAVSSEELFEHVWNEEADLFSQTLKAQINNLRRKIDIKNKTSLISTIKNVGYKIEE